MSKYSINTFIFLVNTSLILKIISDNLLYTINKTVNIKKKGCIIYYKILLWSFKFVLTLKDIFNTNFNCTSVISLIL